jgi:hypothetical protein
MLQSLPLLASELRLGRIKFQPMCDGKRVRPQKKWDSRNFLYCLRSIGKLDDAPDMVVDIKDSRIVLISPGGREQRPL